MHILIHLINQKQHCQIERQVFVAKVCQAVKELTVLTTKMNRHYISLIFNTFRDKSLFPWDISDNHSGNQLQPLPGSYGSVFLFC